MSAQSAPDKIELFHLLFLRHLGDKLDKNLYALKGGCNLRFFFRSIRYSEDMDLDIKTIAKDTLKVKVEKILDSTAFKQNLQARDLEIGELSAPKQTETTQRWKIALRWKHSAVPLRTKVEFSRRGITDPIAFEAIESEIIRNYELSSILANHYTKESAYIQKLSALINRAEIQARDVFDLNLLYDVGAKPKSLPKDLQKNLKKAQETALSISYGDYKSQVFAYLHPRYQEHFGSEKSWNEIVMKVVESLEAFHK